MVSPIWDAAINGMVEELLAPPPKGQLWYKLYTTQTPFVEKSEDKYGYHPGIKNSRELSSSG